MENCVRDVAMTLGMIEVEIVYGAQNVGNRMVH